ncbi:MAG TPA: DUF167 family protein [Thermoleophilaceae bacterium]|nr:DUF167 family protein [Thermoleophilaceae bacterium]
MAVRSYLSEREGDALVRVRLQPRARGDEIVGERAGALLVRVTAPPVDGRANDALCRLLANAVGVAPGRVGLIRGASARDKVVRLEGVDAEAAGGRLP